MRGISIYLAASLLSTQVHAITLQKRTDGPARVIEFPIARNYISDPISRDRLRRRAETVQATLDNTVRVIVTTSSDLYY